MEYNKNWYFIQYAIQAFFLDADSLAKLGVTPSSSMNLSNTC